MGLLTLNITYTLLFQVSSLYHQPDLTVSIAAAIFKDILNSHELLICSPNLLRPQLFTYFVFYKLLFISLPFGSLFTGLFR